MPINQTINKIFMSCYFLFNITIQSHSANNVLQPNQSLFIVASFNPIPHTPPVYFGTNFKVLIA